MVLAGSESASSSTTNRLLPIILLKSRRIPVTPIHLLLPISVHLIILILIITVAIDVSASSVAATSKPATASTSALISIPRVAAAAGHVSICYFLVRGLAIVIVAIILGLIHPLLIQLYRIQPQVISASSSIIVALPGAVEARGAAVASSTSTSRWLGLRSEVACDSLASSVAWVLLPSIVMT